MDSYLSAQFHYVKYGIKIILLFGKKVQADERQKRDKNQYKSVTCDTFGYLRNDQHVLAKWQPHDGKASVSNDKATPVAMRARKATDLPETAGLPHLSIAVTEKETAIVRMRTTVND